jgi:hypothetical protein
MNRKRDRNQYRKISSFSFSNAVLFNLIADFCLVVFSGLVGFFVGVVESIARIIGGKRIGGRRKRVTSGMPVIN